MQRTISYGTNGTNGTRVHTIVPFVLNTEYHGTRTMVPLVLCHTLCTNGTMSTRVPCTGTTMVPLVPLVVYHGTMVQAHMLARIVVEIRAADIAVELEPQL